MRFSDIPKILKNIKIIDKLNKKKINYITDHSDDATPSTLLVIDKKKTI